MFSGPAWGKSVETVLVVCFCDISGVHLWIFTTSASYDKYIKCLSFGVERSKFKIATGGVQCFEF